MAAYIDCSLESEDDTYTIVYGDMVLQVPKNGDRQVFGNGVVHSKLGDTEVYIMKNGGYMYHNGKVHHFSPSDKSITIQNGKCTNGPHPFFTEEFGKDKMVIVLEEIQDISNANTTNKATNSNTKYNISIGNSNQKNKRKPPEKNPVTTNKTKIEKTKQEKPKVPDTKDSVENGLCDMSCVMCLQNVRKIVYIPCGHFLYCASCAQRHLESETKKEKLTCSICSMDVEKMYVVYI